MKKLEITVNNKLIAEFIGKKKAENYYSIFIDEEIELCYYDTELLFHSSWAWLMSVINKCYESQLFGSNNLIQDIKNSFITVDIEVTYQAVVEFIKWYNENK